MFVENVWSAMCVLGGNLSLGLMYGVESVCMSSISTNTGCQNICLVGRVCRIEFVPCVVPT